MGNRDPQQKKHRESPSADEIDEDPDDDDEEVDDNEIRDLEQMRLEPSSGRQWREISSTNESITYALPIVGDLRLRPVIGTIGCLVRVKAWGLEGEPMMTTTWLPGVTLEELETDPDETPERKPPTEET